jgi:non-ribosomal peptide synthetase component F
MNTRDRIAAGKQPGDARVQADTGVATLHGMNHIQQRFCADAHFDDVFGFDCDNATAQALQTLAARCHSSVVVVAGALGTFARLHGCEQLRLGLPMVKQTGADATDQPGQFVDSFLVATDPAKTVAQWLQELNQSVPSLADVAPVSLFLARNEAFELHLQLTSDDAGLHGHLAYMHALFDHVGAQRYITYLQRTLQAMAEDDAQPLDRIELLDAAEHAQLAAWNATDVDYPTGLCVHQLFEAQVERTPDAVALRFEDQSLSYAELNRQANRLAHHLIALGVGPDARVAICAERSLEMVIGLYAILKAGGAYVPLDPAYPRDRLAYQLDDCAPALLLAQRALQALVADATVPTFWLDDLSQLPVLEQNPQPAGLTAQHLAYVIYTSGSTGQPKGVMNQHDGVANRLLWAQQQFALDGRDRVLQKTPFGFDVSVWEFFLPLMTGAQLVMARPGGHQDPQYLAECTQANAISVVHFVPSMLQAFWIRPICRAARVCGT